MNPSSQELAHSALEGFYANRERFLENFMAAKGLTAEEMVDQYDMVLDPEIPTFVVGDQDHSYCYKQSITMVKKGVVSPPLTQ
jgi:hypothetical protein